MAATPQGKVPVACPHCGHSQLESREAFSTNCRACGQYFRVQEVLQDARRPVRKPAEPPRPEQKQITCFRCGAELMVAVNAESTMCRRCSAYVDLQNYRITRAVSRNFQTKGAFIIESRGYVFNCEAVVGEAVIKGRFLGKLLAERSLTIYTNAEIKGSFTTACLIIPEKNVFRWPEEIKVGGAEIAGELQGNLRAEGTVILKATAHLFGDLWTRHLVVEAGAVFVGRARVGLAGAT